MDTNPIDISGRFTNGYETSSKGKAHYSQAAAYNEIFNFDRHQKDLSEADNLFIVRQRSQNTVCYRGHQFSFDVNTGSHSAVTVNTGHWGPNVYPGCGRVRAGEMKYLEAQNYKSAVVL